MARRRWVWSPELKELVEVTPDAVIKQHAPLIVGDLPGYQSPTTGLWIEGRKARREDLARSNSRPWEGLEQERKEAQRRVAYAEQARERRMDEAVHRIYHQMPLRHRRAVEGQ